VTMSDAPAREPAAVAAARRVGAVCGYATAHPALIQETNNTVVWLRPHEVIAKVGKWSHSAESLTREHEVASVLAGAGGPVARPVAGIGPTRDEPSGYLVTLWARLEHDPDRVVDPTEAGASLRALHDALMDFGGALPSFEGILDLARDVLWDDRAMAPLAAADRWLLRHVYDRIRDEVREHAYRARPIHGEAHDGNLLVTPDGLRWIDLENVSIGPLEWDLAFLPERAADGFPEADRELLDRLRTLNSARVATWCFARWEFEELRWHARYHLDRVRRAEGTGFER
jgi:Ser/Thr protein kinase RdoA (MazF antagonist)